MKWPWTKQAAPPPIERPEQRVSLVQFGDMAESFMASQHWQFFLMLCASVRDAHLTPSTDPNVVLQNHACASLMRELPNKVRHLVFQRARMKAAEEQKQKRLAQQIADGNGRRVVSRPMSA